MRKFFICFVLIFVMTINCAFATYGIKVDTHKCKVYVYQKVNDKWQLLGSKKCCVGKDNQTPTGYFTIGSKEKTFLHDGKNYDYVSYFSGKCAFHSVPRENDNYDNSSLGHKRSNGCVRLSASAAKWIYKYCKRGTKVYIV